MKKGEKKKPIVDFSKPLRNVRQEKFAQLVASGRKIEEAFYTAGYASPATSPINPIRSKSNAYITRNNPTVSARVDALLMQSADAVSVTNERIIEELAHIAFADITEVVEWDAAIPTLIPETNGEYALIQGVKLKPSNELPRRVRAAISEVRQTSTGIAIKFHSKDAALEKLARIRNMFPKEAVTVNNNTINLVDLILQSFELEKKGEGGEGGA